MFFEVGDRFQNNIFRRFAEAFVRRIDRMTGRAMFVHDQQDVCIGDIAALRGWRNGGEAIPATARKIMQATFYGTRMDEPVVSRPSISL